GRFGNRRANEARASRPDGRWNQHPRRHPRPPTRRPTNDGPESPEDAATADHTPMAAPRLVTGKIRLITLKGCGFNRDAPNPCTARAIMSNSMVGANAQAAAAAVKIAMPTKYTLHRPKRSPRRPLTSSGTANVSRYTAETQTAWFTLASKSWVIRGSATATKD